MSDEGVRLRQAAGRAARRIEDTITAYTTVDVEAAIVRLLGAVGVDEASVPLAQRFVERLNAWGVLGSGAARWLAGAMARRHTDPCASVEQTLAEPLGAADLAIPVEVAPEVLRLPVRGAHRTLEARRRARDDRLATLAAGGPGERFAEVTLGDEAVLREAVRQRVDLVVLVCPPGLPPAEETLRRARSVVGQASERAGRFMRLGVRGSDTGSAYLGTQAALLGLDALVIPDGEAVAAHFARHVCALAGVLVLGAGYPGDDLGTELARALVAEQLALLAGLPPTSWGWVPSRSAHRDTLAFLFPSAFVFRPDTGPETGLSHSGAVPSAIAHLRAWQPPSPATAAWVRKSPGYWNPFA